MDIRCKNALRAGGQSKKLERQEGYAWLHWVLGTVAQHVIGNGHNFYACVTSRVAGSNAGIKGGALASQTNLRGREADYSFLMEFQQKVKRKKKREKRREKKKRRKSKTKNHIMVMLCSGRIERGRVQFGRIEIV